MVRKNIVAFFALFLLAQLSFGEKLAVKLTPQEFDQWCWAATSECAIEYYGQEITQTEIVTHVKGSAKNESGSPDEMVKALNMGNLNAKADQNVSSWTEQKIQDMLDEGRPATVGYNRQHVISLVGYTGEIGNATYHMMDPWPVDQGEWKDYTWDTFLDNEIGPLDLIVTTDGELPDDDKIELTSPDAGDEWTQGTDQTITWTDNIDGDVKIELVKGSNKTTISSGTASSGSFDWTVPADQTVGSGYTVVITAADKASVSDESGSFSIVEGDMEEYTLTVNGGSGDGDYTKGTKVSIDADAAPADSLIFDEWTGNGASACDDTKSSSTKLTMLGNDCEVTATYKEKPPTSDNLVVLNNWEGQVDDESTIDIDTSKVSSDTEVTFGFTLGTMANDSAYVWTQVYHYLDTDKDAFKNVSAIELTYKSDDSLELILPQKVLSDAGANYTHILEPSSSWKTVVVNVNMENFKQPSWADGDLKKDLDIAQCSGVGFSPKIAEGTSSNAEFKLVCLVGYVEPVGIISNHAIAGQNLTMSSLTTKALQISVPVAGEYAVQILSVDGRVLFTKNTTLQSGMQSMNWNGSSLANQIVVTKIKGANGLQMLKRSLLK